MPLRPASTRRQPHPWSARRMGRRYQPCRQWAADGTEWADSDVGGARRSSTIFAATMFPRFAAFTTDRNAIDVRRQQLLGQDGALVFERP